MAGWQHKPAFGCLLGTLIALGAPAGAQACACCTEPGQRLETTGPMRDYEHGELDRVKFGAISSLYTTAAFPDDIKGVAAPSDKPYRLRASVAGGQIVFDLSDPEGKSGQIVMAVPRQLSRFEIDPRDGKPDRGLGPTLYKEWRLDADVRLGGIIAAGGNRASARLTLHGRGNSCTGADDFKHWTLAVKGPGVHFTLLGELDSTQPEPTRKP